MSAIFASVVIPAYNQSEFLPIAVRSVLCQTYRNYEIIVVNDASADDTHEVVRQFQSPRLRYIVHDENHGLAAARNTGIEASRGDVIFLLDADDKFHPDKIQAHVEFLEKHPEIGFSYNARFELNHSSTTIREMWRPPLAVSLKDLILGFPFSPSDSVVRRNWAFKVGLFNPEAGSAEDTDFPCKLALAGCRFGGIDRALNYRSYHSGRIRKNLSERIKDVERVQAEIFADPRCPENVRAMGRMAIKRHLLAIVGLALMQNETELAQARLREIVQLSPEVLVGNPCELVDFLLFESVADENADHEDLLRRVFSQLPPELRWLSAHYPICVARACLWKGIRAIIWDREKAARIHFSRAAELNAKLDESLIQHTTSHLFAYGNEFGPDGVNRVISNLVSHLNRVTFRGGTALNASYMINRAFGDYRAGKYHGIPQKVLRACVMNPRFLANRGVASILLRSLLRAGK